MVSLRVKVVCNNPLCEVESVTIVRKDPFYKLVCSYCKSEKARIIKRVSSKTKLYHKKDGKLIYWWDKKKKTYVWR